MPNISIIIPVYNVEKYIRQCLDSIRNQTYIDFEVILVDDGSPDNCPAICDEYVKKDDRFKVIHKKNGGVSEARNDGMDQAVGEWLYLVDSDDWLEVDALEKLYRDANEQNVDCVFTDCVERYSSGKNRRLYMFSQPFRTSEKDTIKAIQKAVLCHKYSPYYSLGADNEYPAPWSKFFKSSLVKNAGIRFDSYVKGQYDDGLFTMYLLERVQSIYYHAEHTYNYRIISESITRKFNPYTIEYLKRNCEKMDAFIMETKQSVGFKQAEYCRRVSFLAATLSSYFFNPNNSKPNREKREELRQWLCRYPFDIAFCEARIEKLENKHKYVLFCGKLRFVRGLEFYTWMKRKIKAGY